jgi:hypothetical protein
MMERQLIHAPYYSLPTVGALTYSRGASERPERSATSNMWRSSGKNRQGITACHWYDRQNDRQNF